MDLKTWVMHMFLEFLSAYNNPTEVRMAHCTPVVTTAIERTVTCIYKVKNGTSLRITLQWTP